MASSPPDSISPLDQRLAAYGFTSFIRLDEKLGSSKQLDYLDLLPRQSNQTPLLTAVAEHQGAALLYLLDATGDAKSDTSSVAALQRLLANRSDPAWLGVLRPGSLEIFPISFDGTAQSQPLKVIEANSDKAPLFFQSLVHGTFEESHRLPGTDYVFNKIFNLLDQMMDAFVPREGKGALDADEVLSMAGRALFFRFLIDRRIVLENECSQICPAAIELKDSFSSADKAAQTSAWLDSTFNGDFLPLIDEAIPANNRKSRQSEYLHFFRRTERLVGKRIFAHLHAILRGWRAIGDAVQTELDWGDFDFAHIPVGVLSQVYESFSHRADPRTARDTSVHYTPRTIAGLMVEQAFAAVKSKADAKVLDSSCGAGIFLVLAFRRLVREHWIRNDERPKAALIQHILYNQLRGFDISEPALRLAALALYITSIELNASPRPPQALRFARNLRGEVLCRFGAEIEDGSASFPLGSLGPEVSKEFDNQFDIVIGNPPWTRLRDDKDKDQRGLDESDEQSITDELNQEFTSIGRRVLSKRGLGNLAETYQNPDKNPDLPFLWRATEWAKEGGVIALAMPGRLFGRTSGKGFEAWRAVLQAVQLTGLINGADLRWSAVWQDMKIPFCIVFARNCAARRDQCFYYTAPSNEPEVNGRGRFRIDYESVQSVSADRVEKQPWILKTLAFGTWLDVDLMERLSISHMKTLKTQWVGWDKKRRKTGKGYAFAEELPQRFVDFLSDLPVFDVRADKSLISDKTYGELFGTNSEGQSSAHRPRRKELYQPPLVIIPQSPGENAEARRAYIVDHPVAFSQSYYGYSCAGHPDAETLASLIYLLAHSTLFDYFLLMTSRRSGFDRQTFNKEEFDALPFPDIARLPFKDKAKVRRLAQRLRLNVDEAQRDMNDFVFALYGLDPSAVQIATDTLFAAASYRKAGKAAMERTDSKTRAPFLETLREELEPYFEVCGEQVAVIEPQSQPDPWKEPWAFVSVSRHGVSVPIDSLMMRKAMDVANQRGCSRIIVHAPGKRGLLIGLLNQRRWWTMTRARLCAQHIIRERLGSCGLPEHG